jgi:K+-sensing histidine kinase KdpD
MGRYAQVSPARWKVLLPGPVSGALALAVAMFVAAAMAPFVTTKRQGMGVGLSISRTIIESHGGQITAEPNHGGGTIFRITLRGVRPEELNNAQ